MISKEWRDARWKFLIAAAVFVLLEVSFLFPYDEYMKLADTSVSAARYAAFEMWQFYIGGFGVIIPLAALLGASLISGEVSGGSIYLLLSKPASRSRLLLTKYGVCAGVLLAATLLGALLLVLVAAVRGYPVGSFVIFPGIALSAVLMWLGSLFVLGVALLASLLFRGVLGSLVATALALFLILEYMPGYADSLLSNWQDPDPRRLYEKVHLYSYWYSEILWYMDMGRSSVRFVCGGAMRNFGCTPYISIPTRFLVSTIAAAVPLLAALWLFNRRAY